MLLIGLLPITTDSLASLIGNFKNSLIPTKFLRTKMNFNNVILALGSEMDEDVSRLKSIALSISNDSGFHGSSLSEDLINEMCRFGGAELHAVAAFVGGVASQEVIKVCSARNFLSADPISITSSYFSFFALFFFFPFCETVSAPY